MIQTTEDTYRCFYFYNQIITILNRNTVKNLFTDKFTRLKDATNNVFSSVMLFIVF